MPLVVTVDPDPFDPLQGFEVTVSGGNPPYDFEVPPPPVNPPGASVTPHQSGSAANATVPIGTAPGTQVTVRVRDSSVPPERANAHSDVA